MNKNYIVSWFDSEENEWLSDWCKFAEAIDEGRFASKASTYTLIVRKMNG